jgi:hypothetical protein
MVGCYSELKGSHLADMNLICRLNTKIASRDLEVKDLVKDLSDGVSGYLTQIIQFLTAVSIGHPHPSP